MRESISTLLDLLTRPEFRTGLAIGLIGLLALALLRRAPGWARPWALTTAVAVLVGVQLVDSRRLGLVAGIAIMALGGWFLGRAAASRPATTPAGTQSSIAWAVLGWPTVAAGAIIIPWRGQVDEDAWFYVATPIVALGVGWAMSTWTRPERTKWLGPLFAITSFGVWTTVPDTELARLLLGVSLPLAVATLPPVSARLTHAGAFALAGVFAWIPALGGETRPASIIGAWACVGMILALPLANGLWPNTGRPGIVAMFVVHALVVLVAARVIGLWDWAVPAALATVALYATALVVVRRLGERSIASD